MPTQSVLQETLRAYVAAGSGLDNTRVIPGNDRSPIPQDTFASLLLVDDVRKGYPTRLQQSNGTTSSISWRRATYSLQFYRKGAEDRAIDFLIYAESESGLTVATDGGFAVVWQPAPSAERLDDIIGDGYEERALINLLIDYPRTTNQDTGLIDTFNGDLVYGDLTADVMHTP